MIRSGSGTSAAPRREAKSSSIASGSIRPGGRARQAPRRLDDLLARSVVERDDQVEAAIGARQRLRFVEQGADVGREPGALADDPHPHPVVVQLGEIVADVALEQAHQHRDFFGRPAPVLGREAVDRQKGMP